MTGKWNIRFLESMRKQADPVADSVVARIIEYGQLDALNSVLKEINNNRGPISSSLPDFVHEYFERSEALPKWADQEKILLGEQIFALYGPEMLSMLSFASLPTTYALQRGANVLAITTQLTRHVHRRIFRTAQFVLDVMQPGGLSLESSGQGIRSAQKVRLIHASIRHYIRHVHKWKSQWDLAWGLPINQEDIAKTMLSFSVTILHGLQKIGVRLKPTEAEAYHHVWCVVGHITGMGPDIQPKNLEEGIELSEAIAKHQNGNSEAGETLARDLLNFQQEFMKGMPGLPATCIRYFSGNEIADILKIAPYNWTVVILHLQIGLMGMMGQFQNRLSPGLKKYLRFLTWNLTYKFVLHEEGEAFYFEIPKELKTPWRIPERMIGTRN